MTTKTETVTTTTTHFILTEAEAMLVRDILGGSGNTALGDAVLAGSNYSSLNRTEAINAAVSLRGELNTALGA